MAPRHRDCWPLGEAGLESRAGLPGVLLGAAALHFFALGREDDVQVAQIVEQLQCPVLGQWKFTFFLQVSPRPQPLGGRLLSVTNSLMVWLSHSLLFQKQTFCTLTWPAESHDNTTG